ncbi:juvenile hormone esterase-like [Ctenocephalides felis]|uniref:juvenile hormone esterase-like n=1 Tax=Ctenocephalides felis TaxID=7515 RepID=UPI000E6E2D04|nr:juvenile hormone esterase-like [Ctenocephalides felis]
MRQQQKVAQLAKQVLRSNQLAPWDYSRVRIRQGFVVGATLDRPTTKGKFFSFFGIPYTESPTGSLRFKPTRNLPKWRNDRDCSKFASHNFSGEDCLTLDIHSPNTRPRHLQPVAIFLHGGDYLNGEGFVAPGGPDYLMEKGLVVVEPRWRRGVLGYMSLANTDYSGNMGAKDLLSVLHWVRENAASFGGNPKCVTIFGCGSEGAALAHALVLAPLARGLVHRVALMGGSLDSRPIMKDPRSMAIRLARALGLESSDMRDVARILRNATYESMQGAIEAIRDKDLRDTNPLRPEPPTPNNPKPFTSKIQSPPTTNPNPIINRPRPIYPIDYTPPANNSEPISDWAIGIISIIFLLIIMSLLAMSVTMPISINTVNTGPQEVPAIIGGIGDTFAIEVEDDEKKICGKSLKGSAMSIEALVTDVIRV